MQPHTNPHIIIGKNGLTEGVIQDIKNKFKTEKTLFIKLNKGCRELEDRKILAETLAEKTKSNVLSLKGGSILLGKH